MDRFEKIVQKVMEKIQETEENTFEVEASGRHVHLRREHVEQLFGKGYQLTKVKDLSQPGQFVSKERVTLVGPKGMFQNVVVLGPEREASQVELSLTDSRSLGINAPIRESGEIHGTPGIIIMNDEQVLRLDRGVIAAKRHIHMTPEDAKKNEVCNGDIVSVKMNSERPLIFEDVVVRVRPVFATYMHIDYDEANACGHKKGDTGKILKQSS